MNDHEAQRIAASVHELRPDWPTASVLTLIRKNLIDKPRRDASVAFAWVACESGTASPARVLEMGPWWKAAGVEGGTTRREVLTPDSRCGICSQSKEGHSRQPWAFDHAFEPDFKHKRDAEAVHLIVQSLKAELTPTAERPAEKTLDDLTPDQRDPRADIARAALTTSAQEASNV